MKISPNFLLTPTPLIKDKAGIFPCAPNRYKNSPAKSLGLRNKAWAPEKGQLQVQCSSIPSRSCIKVTQGDIPGWWKAWASFCWWFVHQLCLALTGWSFYWKRNNEEKADRWVTEYQQIQISAFIVEHHSNLICVTPSLDGKSATQFWPDSKLSVGEVDVLNPDLW